MNEVDEIKKRIFKRKAQQRPVLTDDHFRRIYNAMMKCMVVLLVGIAICTYVKVSPQGEQVKDFIFNDLRFNEATKWINQHLLTFQNKETSATVSQQISYTHLKDNYYTNQSNEALNFDKGRVIYVGEQDILGQYVIVLLENNIEVTYGNLNDVFVSPYDQVEEGTILGTYQDQIMIIFNQGDKEIDYSTFEEFVS